LALLSESSESSGRAVDRGISDTKNGYNDYDVEDRGKAGYTCVGYGKHEGRGFGVDGALAIEEARVIVWDEETNEEEGDDIKL
jgi:hypothetical protein